MNTKIKSTFCSYLYCVKFTTIWNSF